MGYFWKLYRTKKIVVIFFNDKLQNPKKEESRFLRQVPTF